MFIYRETKKGSNEFMCKGKLNSSADDSKGFARIAAMRGARVALHPDEMGKNMDDLKPGQLRPCYKTVPLDDVIDHIVAV